MIRRWKDAAAFRARAEGWLLRSEAEHNLLFGILSQVESGDHGFELEIGHPLQAHLLRSAVRVAHAR